MAHQVNVLEPERLDKIMHMIDYHRHGVILGPLGIVGEPLPQPVERYDMAPFGQAVKIAAPVCGMIGAEIGTEIAAMQQDHRLALALLEIAGTHPTNVDIFFVAQRHAAALVIRLRLRPDLMTRSISPRTFVKEDPDESRQ